MARPKIQRLVQVIEDRGSFGTCSCGGEVLFYTDSGVKCSTCGKLYGLWYLRRKANKQEEQKKWRTPDLEEP